MTASSSRWRTIAQMALGTGILQLANMVTYIALARLLIPEEYGTYRQLFLISQLVWGIIFAALPSTILYFGGRASSAQEKDAIVRQHLWLVAICGMAVFAMIFAGRNIAANAFGNPELARLLAWFSLYPAAQMLIQLVPPVLILKEKTRLMPMYTAGVALFTTSAVVGAAWLYRDVDAVVLAATGMACLSAAAATILTLRLSNRPTHADTSIYEILQYGWPLLLATAVGMVGLRLDHIAVSNLLGPVLYAVYAVGAFEIPIYSLIKSSSGSVFLPEISRLAKSEAWASVLAAWRDMQRKNAALIFPLSAFFFAYSEPLIVTVFGAEYRESAPIFAVFALLAPVRFIAFNTIMRATGHTRFDLFAATFFLLVIATIIWPVTSRFSLLGAAIAVVAGTYTMGFLMLVLTRSATGARFSIPQLYPPRLIVSFAVLVIALWSLSGIGGLDASPILKLLIGSAVTLLISVLLLKKQSLLAPALKT